MTIGEFRRMPASSFDGAVLALWWEARGNWEKAHEVAQDLDGRDGAWLHAYLHRREGDRSNADYWYRRAGKPAETGDLDRELELMVAELLGR